MSKLSLIVLTILILSGCSVSLRTELPTPTEPVINTATLVPTDTPRPTETPLPPPPTPTFVPVPGTTSTQLNVRSEPSTAGEVLGVIAADTIVQIIGQDPGGNWWQILNEKGIDGKGWVTAQYVTVTGEPAIPVIGGGANPGIAGVIIQQLNIRSGPGTNFNSLGLLNANDVVSLTGKNRDGAWLQIDFMSGPDGKGWINTAFVRTDALDDLPIVSELGEVVGTGTPAASPLPPTPTLVAASMDFDSADNPLVSVIFEPNGTNSLIYSGNVSSPDGDPEDWIGFNPYTTVIYARIDCMGTNPVQVKFTNSNTILSCNRSLTPLPVTAGILNLVHVLAGQGSGVLEYTKYTLTIQVNP